MIPYDVNENICPKWVEFSPHPNAFCRVTLSCNTEMGAVDQLEF